MSIDTGWSVAVRIRRRHGRDRLRVRNANVAVSAETPPGRIVSGLPAARVQAAPSCPVGWPAETGSKDHASWGPENARVETHTGTPE